MESRKFSIGAILTVSTGGERLFAEIKEIYEILYFLSDDENLMTHQLPRVLHECEPYILDQMPWLKEVDVSGINKENYKDRMSVIIKKYEEFHYVTKIPKDDHDIIDPEDELKQMGYKGDVIKLDHFDDEPPMSPFGDIKFNK